MSCTIALLFFGEESAAPADARSLPANTRNLTPRNAQVPAAVPPLGAGSVFQVQPPGRTAHVSIPRIEAPRPGTYPSLVRRSRYVLSTGRSSDLVSSRPTAFSALRSSPLGQRLRPMACFVDAPLHSSGPVGESHSVPYSPRPPVQRRLQGTCEYPVILFSISIIAHRLQKYNHLFSPYLRIWPLMRHGHCAVFP